MSAHALQGPRPSILNHKAAALFVFVKGYLF